MNSRWLSPLALATVLFAESATAQPGPLQSAPTQQEPTVPPAEPAASSEESDRLPPASVRGGIYDKPFLFRLGAGASIGGYLDVQTRYEREDGLESFSFVPERFNLFTFAPINEFLRVAAELEIEELGEEIKLELAILDFEIHPAFTLRAGVVLSPLGRFNLAHDSPAMEVVDRPLVSTEILGVTLSEVGIGALGAVFPWSGGRITYEVYGVNGFTEGVVTGSDAGTRVAEGRANFLDNNNRPAVVGRIAVSPHPIVEVGGSVHTGIYNEGTVDGFAVDGDRRLTLWALDMEARWELLTFLFEYGAAEIDLPDGLDGLQASRQHGLYAELDARLLEGRIATLPHSSFNAAVRFDWIDMDREVTGNTQKRITLGANFRPHSDTAFKLDYQFNWIQDPFDNPVRQAALLFGVATYF